MVMGDMHGLNTRKHQPAKLAAIEARWDTSKGVPLTLFAMPDDRAEHNKFAIEIPLLGSLILTGLKDFPADQRPPVAIPFFAFRAMVGCAGVMLALVLLGGWLRWRGRLSGGMPVCNSAWLHRSHRRMVRDRGRPAALDDLRAIAHGCLGVAVSDGL